MFGVVVNILLTVIAVSLIIVVHEFGHFLGARLVGMRVEVFSIGFWKRLVGFKKGHTDYRISLVPLGGYLKVAGESPEEGKGKPYEFWSKSPGQRAIFIAGGVLMNFVLAIVLFIVAFSIGVPFTVADVGEVVRGEPAWHAGLEPRDRIVEVDGRRNPVFNDVTMAIALGGKEEVGVRVLRDGQERDFTLRPEYAPDVGLRLVGIVPAIEPLVTGYAEVGGEGGRSPAREAGIEPGDRILAINERPVRTAQELEAELSRYPHDEVELLVRRGNAEMTFRVLTEPLPRYVFGIVTTTTRIEALHPSGPARQAGFRVGDVIAEVNGRPVQSVIALERNIKGNWGPVEFTVRRDGQTVRLRHDVPDVVALNRFTDSLVTESGTVLTWVDEGGPAWEAGLRPGDRLAAVGGEPVDSWSDILRQTQAARGSPLEFQWVREGDMLSQTVAPVRSTDSSRGHLGIAMTSPVTEPRRYGPVGAVVRGVEHVWHRLAEFVLTVRGFATQQVSPRHMGGIVAIVHVAYWAAAEGAGKLLYITAVISVAIAFLNLLPIPVLDGGHLLFLAVEKIRGRRVAENIMIAAQTVGLVLLGALVLYVTWNDILRYFTGF